MVAIQQRDDGGRAQAQAIVPEQVAQLFPAPLAGQGAAIAQQAPGLVLQELRNMAAGNLIGFELSREEGLAYEVRPSDGHGSRLLGP